MEVIETIQEVRETLRPARRGGEVIALVPTMGALHEGHFSLIDAARRQCDIVVVSIFVNPTQFGPGEDLSTYPRRGEADCDACAKRGVDLVFMPSVEEMYDPAAQTQVSVGLPAQSMCGRSRPTHFAGVCTVVAKLFNIVAPNRAYFGAKDFQQAVIIRRMVADLNFAVEIVVCPTVREGDGLALSSRNARLSDDHRRQALALWQSLQLADEMIRRDRPPAETVCRAIRRHLADRAGGGQVDYVEIVDPQTLSDVESTNRPVLVALAVRFGQARLIDNILVDAAEKQA